MQNIGQLVLTRGYRSCSADPDRVRTFRPSLPWRSRKGAHWLRSRQLLSTLLIEEWWEPEPGSGRCRSLASPLLEDPQALDSQVAAMIALGEEMAWRFLAVQGGRKPSTRAASQWTPPQRAPEDRLLSSACPVLGFTDVAAVQRSTRRRPSCRSIPTSSITDPKKQARWAPRPVWSLYPLARDASRPLAIGSSPRPVLEWRRRYKCLVGLGCADDDLVGSRRSAAG